MLCVTMELNDIQKEDFQRRFQQWKDRRNKYVQAREANFKRIE